MDTKIEKNTEIKKTRRPVYYTGIAFGVLLILFGGLLISAKLGSGYDFNKIVLSWQMLLIVIGILCLRRHPFSGLCLVIVGGFFIVPVLAEVFPDTFYFAGENFISDYWGLLLIGAGILIVIYWIFSPKRKINSWDYEKHAHFHCSKNGKKYELNNEFSKAHVFSAGEYIVLESEFKGGSVKVVFGATEIDLRKTKLPPGDTYLEISAVFSGVVLFIPDEWKVESQMECVASGISDKRRFFESADASRRLILVGSCVFSGCEIKN